MAPPTLRQTTPLTPPSTPPTPNSAHLTPLPDTPHRLPLPLPLPLPPSSPSSPPHLPRITITLNSRPMPTLPWRPCQPTRPWYDNTSLAPLRRSELLQRRQQQPRELERPAQQQPHAEAFSVPEALEALEATEPLLLPEASLLRPIARELIRWRLLTFYNLNTAAAAIEGAKARENILAAGIDWQRTWDLLRSQRARYLVREKRSSGLGLFSKLNLRGLHVLRAVHRAAASAGVSIEMLGLAVEAFAKREGVEEVSGSIRVRGLVGMKEWGVLARCLLIDRGLQVREREVLFPSSRDERGRLWDEICVKREEAVKRYFSVLEYEEQGASYYCFPSSSCAKRKVMYQLLRRENAQLDSALELQRQLLRAVPASRTAPGQHESESESGKREERRSKNAPEAKGQKKHVRISVDVDEAQQNSKSASRASWDSEEERQMRRKERREFVFGKEDEDQNQGEKEEEQRREQERKRRLSLERVMAANAKWNRDYADC